MRRFHLIFGSLLFIVFLVTGQFMRADFPDKDVIDQELRILMRSRHIYILYSALIHVVLGVYVTVSSRLPARVLQHLGSLTLSISSILLVWAFIAETYSFGHFSEISRQGIYTSLAGTILIAIGGIRSEPPV